MRRLRLARRLGLAVLLLSLVPPMVSAAPPTTAPGDAMLRDYFRAQVEEIADGCLADVKTLDDWTARRDEYRRQLLEMLGLWPLPPRTALEPVVTGTVDQPQYTVEKLYFQSRPGLYVTGDLYVPKGLKERAPAILYVCGHGTVKKDGVAYGAKAAYQHHGEWFARNGYVCLIIDTLQLGEIEGIHHGLYRERMWWWQSRGYTPEGVEAWNSMRAIDYLCSRPEVDPNRIGMTGRSGGGAYTWYTAALDERVKVAVPVAGMTDLQNYVVDGCIEGHCDCMFMVNTHRWDFPMIAALIAPRPVLYSNSDKDNLFPLDGVVRTYEKARRIYRLYGAEDKLGLLITEGPHKDTQELQVPAFKWFNRFLKNETADLTDAVAAKALQPEQLRVFPSKGLPADQVNTRIQETLVATAPPPPIPASRQEWAAMRDQWMADLRRKVFAGWPTITAPPGVTEVARAADGDVELRVLEFESQPGVRLRAYLLTRTGVKPASISIRVLDEASFTPWLAALAPGFNPALADERTAFPSVNADATAARGPDDGSHEPSTAILYLAPRGVGLTAFSAQEKARTHILRRFELIGQTLDGMRVWDVRRGIQAARAALNEPTAPVRLQARGEMGSVALYASLFEDHVDGLELAALPPSHRQGPQLLNVLQVLDVPAAVALASERCPVVLTEVDDPTAWQYPMAVTQTVGHRLKVVEAGKHQ